MPSNISFFSKGRLCSSKGGVTCGMAQWHNGQSKPDAREIRCSDTCCSYHAKRTRNVDVNMTEQRAELSERWPAGFRMEEDEGGNTKQN